MIVDDNNFRIRPKSISSQDRLSNGTKTLLQKAFDIIVNDNDGKNHDLLESYTKYDFFGYPAKTKPRDGLLVDKN